MIKPLEEMTNLEIILAYLDGDLTELPKNHNLSQGEEDYE